MWQLRFKGPEWLFLPIGLLLYEWGSCKTQYSLLKLVIAFERFLCFFCALLRYLNSAVHSWKDMMSHSPVHQSGF